MHLATWHLRTTAITKGVCFRLPAGYLALFNNIRLSLQLELGSPATFAQQQSAPLAHLGHEHARPLQAVSGPLGLANNVCLSLQLALGCTGIRPAQ